MNVRLTKAQKIKVINSHDVFLVMQQILLRENRIERGKEHFWVICLSNSNKILLIELTSLGTASQTLVDTTEIFSFALQKRAAKVILAHNHPSGELRPSERDRDITDRMYQAGLFLEVPVIDHIILDESHYYSFQESGLLLKLSRSRKYVMPFKKEEERIRKEGEKVGMRKGEKIGIKKGEERGLKKKAVEMAKILKKKGVDVNLIAVASKLSIKEIEKL